jgi:hypothetical protein
LQNTDGKSKKTCGVGSNTQEKPKALLKEPDTSSKPSKPWNETLNDCKTNKAELAAAVSMRRSFK